MTLVTGAGQARGHAQHHLAEIPRSITFDYPGLKKRIMSLVFELPQEMNYIGPSCSLRWRRQVCKAWPSMPWIQELLDIGARYCMRKRKGAEIILLQNAHEKTPWPIVWDPMILGIEHLVVYVVRA